MMLSVLSSRAGAGTFLKCRRLSEGSVTFASSKCDAKKDRESSQSLSSKSNAQSGQSHPLNFPRLQRLETNPPVRFGFIPKAWFDFFYEKTGVTGGYMLMFGGTVTLFSKEILVINPEMCRAFSFITLVTVIQKLYGQNIYDYISKKQEKTRTELDASQYEKENHVRNQIKELEKDVWCNVGVAKFLPEAKLENVYMQMEIEYRQRLKTQYTAVKNILDYQVAKTDIERVVLRKTLSSWILRNVYQSITPEIKKKALKKSIEDLRVLAAKKPSA